MTGMRSLVVLALLGAQGAVAADDVPPQVTPTLRQRAEDLAGLPEFAGRASVVTARAVALEALLGVAASLLEPAGRVLVMQSQKEPPDRTAAHAARAGFALRERRDYTLAGGEARRVVVLGRP